VYCACKAELPCSGKNKILESGGYLLSPLRSTIGARRLNFRVRNGNGCDPSAKPPDSKILFLRPEGLGTSVSLQEPYTLSIFLAENLARSCESALCFLTLPPNHQIAGSNPTSPSYFISCDVSTAQVSSRSKLSDVQHSLQEHVRLVHLSSAYFYASTWCLST
jgi:hypothetical protein